MTRLSRQGIFSVYIGNPAPKSSTNQRRGMARASTMGDIITKHASYTRGGELEGNSPEHQFQIHSRLDLPHGLE